MLIRNKIF